ncbi:hypothetical protein LTR62_002814 [Meristemomyces frigidus]|uniref:DUF7918 domain-containing protein n=1 Tax=Meristemomyces frigidus TaxID=1508187 RepID=A0AAN7TP68_9PEZI|nr:hypothetical protein LTR62_002814 [Meristemomyces frigidus]
MKLEGVKRITVSVQTDKKDLPEYEDDQDELYIPTIAGAGNEFGVHCHIKQGPFTSPNPQDEVGVLVKLDGVYTGGRIIRLDKHRREDMTCDVDGIYDFQRCVGTVLKPFTFAQLATDDKPTKDLKLEAIKNLGEIRIELKRGRRIAAALPLMHGVKYQSAIKDSISEKALKGRAMSQKASVGQAIPCGPQTTVKMGYPYGRKPLATFTFKYRSRRDLQIQGIIRRSPSPTPLEARDPDTLTAEEARELVRRIRRREDKFVKVEREDAKRPPPPSVDDDDDSDDDEVMIESEAHRRKRHRVAADAEVEVIDLT